MYKLVNYNIKNNHIANNDPTKELLLNLETESKELIDDNYGRFVENLSKPIFTNGLFITQNIALYQSKEDSLIGKTYELIKKHEDSPLLLCTFKLIGFDVIAEFNYNGERVFRMPLFLDELVTHGIYGLLKELIEASPYSYCEDNLTNLHEEFIREITSKWTYNLEFYNFAFLNKPITSYSLHKLVVMLFDAKFSIDRTNLESEGYLTLDFIVVSTKLKFNIEDGICKEITRI